MNYTDRRQTQTAEQYAADDLETMREAKRYGAHLFRLFRPYVGRRVLEVGCGIGTMTRRLTEVSDLVLGIEPNPHCADLVRDEMRNEPKFSLRTCHLEECDLAELAAQQFDTVFCVNVLEHIEDDRGELGRALAAIRPGGHLLVFVPALAWLYSDFDRRIGHARRYSRAGLVALVRAAGFEVVRARYFDLAGVLPWYVNFVLLRRGLGAGGVALYDRLVVPPMRRLEGWIAPPLGKNLLMVARKPE